MNNDDFVNYGVNMTRMLNYGLHAEQLSIPMLNGFKVEKSGNPQIVFIASGDGGFLEQLTSDGHIEDGDFYNRIDLVISNTKEYLKSANCENADNSFIKYRNYNNGVFDFELYVQDMIIPTETDKKVIRSFNAYFVEPKMHDFYQFSLSAGPFVMPTQKLKIGVIDLENDEITKLLDNMMKTLLDNLKYKN